MKRDAFLAEQNPEPLVADVVDHPLGDQELRQLRQAVPGRTGLGELLDLPALREGDLRRLPAPVPGVERVEPVGVEVVDDIPDPQPLAHHSA